MPDVPRNASNTIWGTVRVGVRVLVDAAGNVTQAEIQSEGPSRYFARLSLEAARKWHFAPPAQNGQAVASVWLLHFGYRHDGMGVEPEQTKP
jgi:TonB family protein